MTLNRSFYPSTSTVPPVSFLMLHPREIPGTNYVVTDSETEKNRKSLKIKVGKSSASVPGYACIYNVYIYTPRVVYIYGCIYGCIDLIGR